MRHAVLAAALSFNPRHAWARRPFVGVTRQAAKIVLAYLDRRREVADRGEPLA